MPHCLVWCKKWQILLENFCKRVDSQGSDFCPETLKWFYNLDSHSCKNGSRLITNCETWHGEEMRPSGLPSVRPSVRLSLSSPSSVASMLFRWMDHGSRRITTHQLYLSSRGLSMCASCPGPSAPPSASLKLETTMPSNWSGGGSNPQKYWIKNTIPVGLVPKRTRSKRNRNCVFSFSLHVKPKWLQLTLLWGSPP